MFLFGIAEVRDKGLHVHTLTLRLLSGSFWRKALYSEEGGVSKMPKVNYPFAFASPFFCHPLGRRSGSAALESFECRETAPPLHAVTFPSYSSGLKFLQLPRISTCSHSKADLNTCPPLCCAGPSALSILTATTLNKRMLVFLPQ